MVLCAHHGSARGLEQGHVGGCSCWVAQKEAVLVVAAGQRQNLAVAQIRILFPIVHV